MKKYLHLLERIGLNGYEQRVYLTLLEYPYITMSEIAEKNQIHRPMAYKTIQSLESEGFVEKSYLDGKRYYYHTTSPKKLLEKLKRLNELAEQVIPELETIYMKHGDLPILSTKEGIDGIRSIHQDLLDSVPRWGIYYRYSSSRTEYAGKSLYTPENYETVQNKKELERVIITSERQQKNRTTNPNREVITIPKAFDEFDDNITKLIYADKVAIIDYDTQTGWVIENEHFARYEEKIFRLLAKLLKEKNPSRTGEG